MILKIISREDYLNFALNNEFISIYQLPEWGSLKEGTGWKSHLLGIYVDEKLIGVTLLLEKKLFLNRSLFYAPRGFLFNIDDFDLLKEFTNLIKQYIKEHHGFMLKVDPNVIYATYDENKENKVLVHESLVENMNKLGYKHLGFTENFETMQPRWLCRINLKDNYEDTLNTFTKSTRKNIEKTLAMAVKTREVDSKEIELFTSLLEETANLKNFVIRPASYYEKMYNLMSDYIKLYITYLDTYEYYNYLNREVESTKKELETVVFKMQKDHVGNKLTTKKEQMESKLLRLNKDLEIASQLKNEAKTIDIGALMSIFIGDEGITFMSGTKNKYKVFNPKYAFYNEHIKECIKQNKKYCNFYGISGDMNHNNPYYAIYEIKKGFKPEIIELVGEFDLVTNKVIYRLYKVALKCYKLFKT